jgi:hypothetical protein
VSAAAPGQASAGRWFHLGCGGTVTFDISGGWCGVCEAEGLSDGDYAQQGLSPEAERDYAEFSAWWQAKGYPDGISLDFSDARDAFASGMRAARAIAAREPDAGTTAAQWRQGRSQPRNVYARTGGDWTGDQLIGHFDTDELAAEACRAHNSAREPDAADGNAPELRITDCSAHDDALHIQINTGHNWLCAVALASILAEYEPQPEEPQPEEPQPAPGLAARYDRLYAGMTSIAEGLEQRADVNRPSKVTEICDGIAASLRKLLERK